MDQKIQCGPTFLPMRSLGPATLSHGMLQSSLLPTSHSWTTIGAAIVLWPRCQGWNGWRRPSKAEGSKMYDMSYYWSCEPQQLLWVGGTYARDPKNFSACQQETAWIYANLRPLRIQPPIELMRLHIARPCQRAPDWPAPRLARLHEISVEACGAQLYKHMKLHGMLRYPAGLWYAYELPVTWFKSSY